jgi:hypothetical protein
MPDLSATVPEITGSGAEPGPLVREFRQIVMWPVQLLSSRQHRRQTEL